MLLMTAIMWGLLASPALVRGSFAIRGRKLRMALFTTEDRNQGIKPRDSLNCRGG